MEKHEEMKEQEMSLREEQIMYRRALALIYGVASRAPESAAPAIANLVDDSLDNDHELLRRGYIPYLINSLRGPAKMDFLKENILRGLVTLVMSKSESWINCFGFKAYTGDIAMSNLAVDIMSGAPAPTNVGSASDLTNAMGITSDEIGYGVTQVYIEFICRELDVLNNGIVVFIDDLIKAMAANRKFARAVAYLIFLCMSKDQEELSKIATQNEVARNLLFAPMPETDEPKESFDAANEAAQVETGLSTNSPELGSPVLSQDQPENVIQFPSDGGTVSAPPSE